MSKYIFTHVDKTVLDYGHKLIDLCTATNMCILNGRAFDDKNVGRLTCCNHRGQSVVDYALVDKNVMYSCIGNGWLNSRAVLCISDRSEIF